MSARSLLLAALIAATALLGGCGGDDDEADAGPEERREVVAAHADMVHAAYSASLASARELDAAVDAFVAEPTDASLEAAQAAWLAARDDYGPTEAFRFYGGPIDDEETGPEGQINAWPLDEAYVDYVVGDQSAGIVNDPEGFPAIDMAMIAAVNEEGAETNVSTGWHAIEFLLWGQDLSADGPGARPVSDYSDAPNADRRGQYLVAASDLLIADLEGLVAAWDPAGADNYRAEFLAEEPDEALRRIITGIGELSRGELAGERMSVAYLDRSQEDEHSCFSDNTTADIVANARGIEMVYLGRFDDIEGPGVGDLVAAVDPDLDAALREQLAASVAATEAIPAPFDQHLTEDAPDDGPGRTAILTAIESLEDQTDTIVAGAGALDITINVS